MNIIIIPAHLDSKRFPNKAITEINGLPLIVKTYQNCLKSNLVDKVVCAISNSKKLIDICKDFNMSYEITGTHKSGSSRVNEIQLNLDTKIINCQVDYPEILGTTFDHIFNRIDISFMPKIVSCYYQSENQKDLNNKNNVKVNINKCHQALFFSRYPISNLIHIGIYGYTKFLLKSLLDRYKQINYDNLEQYSWLYYNNCISLFSTKPTLSINVPSDLDSL